MERKQLYKITLRIHNKNSHKSHIPSFSIIINMIVVCCFIPFKTLFINTKTGDTLLITFLANFGLLQTRFEPTNTHILNNEYKTLTLNTK